MIFKLSKKYCLSHVDLFLFGLSMWNHGRDDAFPCEAAPYPTASLVRKKCFIGVESLVALYECKKRTIVMTHPSY
jgi:hypothetical protein